jgi:hypothetical protein
LVTTFPSSASGLRGVDARRCSGQRRHEVRRLLGDLWRSSQAEAKAARLDPENLDELLDETERAQILHALEASNGVIGGPNGAAARLGLKRSTLQLRMQRLGIHLAYSNHRIQTNGGLTQTETFSRSVPSAVTIVKPDSSPNIEIREALL